MQDIYNILNKSIAIRKKAIEQTYIGIASITEYKRKKDPVTKITVMKEILLYEEVPCRLTYDSIHTAVQTDTSNTASQQVSLLIAPELLINPGNKIKVTQSGRTTVYTNSGLPNVYGTHQVISLELLEEMV